MSEPQFIGWPNEGVEYWNAHWRGMAAQGFFDDIQEDDPNPPGVGEAAR